MIRMALIAVGAGLFPTLAIAQMAPPSPTGGDYRPLPESMGPQDKASDPNSLDRMRDALQSNRIEQVAKSARSDLGRSRPAKAAEIQAGKPVNDSTGLLTAIIEKVEADGVVLYNGASSVKVPLEAFGVNKKGLLLDMTKQEFDQLVASANLDKKS